MTEAKTRIRLKTLAVLVVFMFGALTTRLWFLQVLASPQFAKQAAENQVRLVPIMPLRGEILDRTGKVLVGNRSSVEVTIDRQELGDKTDAVLFRLSELLHVPVKRLTERMNNVQYLPYQPVPVAEDVPKDEVFYIREHADLFPGVNYELQAVRSYPQGPLAAQALGHVGRVTPEQAKGGALKNFPATAQVGQAGIEQAYDSYLRGVPGTREIQVNAQGRVLNPNFNHISATPGDNVVLSLDAKAQRLAEQSLAQGIEVAHQTFDTTSGKYLQATGGAVIVMDPKTGRVLALASNPTFDPSVWIDGVTQNQFRTLAGTGSVPGALFNRAIQGAYPPGSTFKPFIGTAALKQGFINESKALNCPGQYEVPGDTSHTVFHNWTPTDSGYMTLGRALIQSCDTFFYQLGYMFWQQLVHSGYNIATGRGGKELMQRDLKEMGFGSPTGIDLPLEASGVIPTAQYKRALEKQAPKVYGHDPWFPGDNVNMAIGQGFVTVTPMEMAVAYSAIANGGRLYSPRLAWKIEAPGGKVLKVVRPSPMGRLPISKQEVAYIRNALVGVTRPGGTASPAFVGFPVYSIPVAAKTGTADIVGKQPYSWFAAMAPANDPKYVVVAMVEQGGHGGTTAAPVVRRILQGLFGLQAGRVTAGQDQST